MSDIKKKVLKKKYVEEDDFRLGDNDNEPIVKCFCKFLLALSKIKEIDIKEIVSSFKKAIDNWDKSGKYSGKKIVI